MRSSVWTSENDVFLRENAHNYSFEELGKMLKTGKRSIGDRVKFLGINNIKNKSNRYTYNKDYFENIDNEDKAYWLGFIASDGCIVDKVDSKKLKIALKYEDVSHLEKFVKSIDGDIKIYKKISKIGDKEYESCEMSVNCTKMCNDLINLGVGHNKTEKLEMPNIESHLVRHFVRGFIDGDGCLYVGVRKDSGRPRFSVEIVGYKGQILNDINDYFNSNEISSKIYFKRKNNDKLGVYAKKSIDKLIDMIYINSKVYLDRKYEKALLIRSM